MKEDIEEKIFEAYATWDKPKFLRLCGFKPEDDANRLLYEQAQADMGLGLSEVELEIIDYDRRHNKLYVPNWWGIKSAFTHMVKWGLVRVHYGYHNLEIPIEMLNLSNADEIFAKWFAAGQLKTNNQHLDKPRLDFYGLIRELDSYSYSFMLDNNNLFSKLRGKNKRFSASPKMQRYRLSLLSDADRSAFVNSYYRPVNASNLECPNDHDFFESERPTKKALIQQMYTEIGPLHDRALRESASYRWSRAQDEAKKQVNLQNPAA